MTHLSRSGHESTLAVFGAKIHLYRKATLCFNVVGVSHAKYAAMAVSKNLYHVRLHMLRALDLHM